MHLRGKLMRLLPLLAVTVAVVIPGCRRGGPAGKLEQRDQMIVGSAVNPTTAQGPGATQLEPEATSEAARRKARSEAVLLAEAVPLNHSLPLIEEQSEA